MYTTLHKNGFFAQNVFYNIKYEEEFAFVLVIFVR